ncbi:2-dehydro-3-deoxy-phosphogluconate aldolase [Adhaeribacter aerolatus]|uniref:2-dehydro-3-deoxy-phosphogluconate aldolase n=1 Tax=Adhaeribacter aerolatus TaxID=670289 RepID=A0A512B2A0_9BACT|nr:bifunctional 4-hydroxy-2-oxoglutarate aldolase/2-dehydro-3-deoxy-phosphogluconate aldolase [Adhaeribacter aerolatus]GEO06086.1 2-dehydro-3-deoxy-phosphogluconate aldolase [Adhaeribacter aerolatus]
MSQNFSWDHFHKVPVIGIMRNMPPHQTEALADCYASAGLTTLEITMNSAGAAETITRLAQDYGDRLNIGAGTVCDLQDLDKALKAGASFIVTPILDEAVIRACVAAHIPVFPGAYTPTEIFKAWRLGASMVKVFPASKLGPEFIKELLAPLNYLKLLPTGGINLQNFREYFKAGAQGVGIGSGLFPAELIKHDRWDELKELYSQIVQEVAACVAPN